MKRGTGRMESLNGPFSFPLGFRPVYEDYGKRMLGTRDRGRQGDWAGEREGGERGWRILFCVVYK